MSTLKVDTIQSSTGASPVTINDTLNVAGNTAVTGTLSTTSTASLAALKVFTASVQSTGLGGASPIIQVSNTGGSTSTISNRGYGLWAGLALGRSGSSVLDTLSATADTNALGYITFDGVNSSNNPTSAGYIVGTQSGAAGATYLGGTIDTYVGTNAAAATKITSISSTGLSVTGAINSTGAAVFGASGAPPFGTLAVKATTNKWVGIGFPAIAATGGRVIGLNDGGGTSPLELDGTTVDLLSTGVSVAKVSSTGLAVTGLVQGTAENSGKFLSGSAATRTYVSFGTSSVASFIGVAGSGGGVISGSAANDFEIAVDGNPIRFSAGLSRASSNMVLSSTGLAVTGLLDLSAATSGQIKFPATQNASADANTLDDYEEGTWTPTDASGAGLSITGTDCKYTKVGRLVTLSGNLAYPVTASGANAKVAVPFTPGQQRAAGAAAGVSANVSSYVAPNDAGLYFITNTGGAVQTNATLSGSNVLVTITYSV